MKKLIIALSILFLILCVSCNKNYDYEIGVNEQIEITLESTGYDGGYSWYWSRSDNVLDSVNWEFIPYDETYEGSPGIERWTFVGKRKGSTVIKLNYKHPWEDEKIKSQEYSVKVR